MQIFFSVRIFLKKSPTLKGTNHRLATSWIYGHENIFVLIYVQISFSNVMFWLNLGEVIDSDMVMLFLQLNKSLKLMKDESMSGQ